MRLKGPLRPKSKLWVGCSHALEFLPCSCLLLWVIASHSFLRRDGDRSHPHAIQLGLHVWLDSRRQYLHIINWTVGFGSAHFLEWWSFKGRLTFCNLVLALSPNEVWHIHLGLCTINFFWANQRYTLPCQVFRLQCDNFYLQTILAFRLQL